METRSFGPRLRLLRKERGLTLKGMAELSGLSISYLSDLERGQATPSFSALEALAGALGMKPSELLMEEDWVAPDGLAQYSMPVPSDEPAEDRVLESRSEASPSRIYENEESVRENQARYMPSLRSAASEETKTQPDSDAGRSSRKAIEKLRYVEKLRQAEMLHASSYFDYIRSSARSPSSLPPGLLALLEDHAYRDSLTPEWLGLLASLSRRAAAISGKPLTKGDFLEVFLHLRRIIGPQGSSPPRARREEE